MDRLILFEGIFAHALFTLFLCSAFFFSFARAIDDKYSAHSASPIGFVKLPNVFTATGCGEETISEGGDALFEGLEVAAHAIQLADHAGLLVGVQCAEHLATGESVELGGEFGQVVELREDAVLMGVHGHDLSHAR